MFDSYLCLNLHFKLSFLHLHLSFLQMFYLTLKGYIYVVSATEDANNKVFCYFLLYTVLMFIIFYYY